MAEQFYTIPTAIGKAMIANSIALGTKINLTTMKIGDSNGSYYNPNESQTDLVHSVYTCNINSVEVDENNANWINIICALPSDVGDFYIREAGAFDDTGALIAIGKYPETYKPIATNGSTKEIYIKMTLEVTSTSSIELKIDPTVVLATKKDIQILTNSINDITTQLSENTQDIAQLSNPNLLINGDFQVWQRGTSFTYTTSAMNYTADRWRNLHQALTSVIEKVSDGIKMTTSNYSSGINRLTYSMEDIDYNKLKGKTVTFSCDYDCNAGFALYISIGGSLGYIEIGGRNWYVSSIGVNNHWKYTFVVPIDISDFSIFIQTTNNGYIVFKNVKLELGDKETPFVPRPYAEELALCQRYFMNLNLFSNGYAYFGLGSYSSGSTVGRVNIPLPVTMRVKPTPTLKGTVDANLSTGSVAISSLSIDQYSLNYARLIMNLASTPTTTGACDVMAGADSNGSILLDAEIY